MKKNWGKPIVQVQVFAPQEYVTNCWYVEKSAMFTTLYEDGKDFIFNLRPDGYYNFFPDEEVDLPTPTRIPASGYFRNGESPQYADTSNHWYTSYNKRTDKYNSNQVYPLQYTYSGKTYYFSSIKESGHS